MKLGKLYCIKQSDNIDARSTNTHGDLWTEGILMRGKKDLGE